jgi:excinuclease ABC subunit C
MNSLIDIHPPPPKTEKERLLRLQETIDIMPNDPGVYIFKNPRERIIYIGKAVKLRARVSSYFRPNAHDGRSNFRFIVRNTTIIEYLLTDTEVEALMLEASLIKQHHPRYNVTLKDDKKYPYLRITKEPFPQILVTRDYEKDGSKYLGPYSDVRAMRTTLRTVYKLFKIRTCKDKLPNSTTRLCLDYEMKRCDGPCEDKITQSDYDDAIREAVLFLSGRSMRIVQTLKDRMKRASRELNFEVAATYRDRISAFEATLKRQKIVSHNQTDWDTVGIAAEDNTACAVFLQVRDGRVVGSHHHFVAGLLGLKNSEKNSDENVFASAITGKVIQLYYASSTFVPREIDLREHPEDGDTLVQWLDKLKENSEDEFVTRDTAPTKFRLPQRGERLNLLKVAEKNARRFLDDRRLKRDNRKNQPPASVVALQRDLRLSSPPRSIEAVDISNTQGDFPVASLVSFFDGRPRKKGYRHYRITDIDGPDDFASIRQVVFRRFKRLMEEGNPFPDLLVVDGGKGQLSSAREALKELGLEDIAVIGLAKRLEEIFLPDIPEAQNIPKTSSSLRLLQHVRDESHRFAITYHRTLRDRRMRDSKLDLINGIGEKRKTALLRHFGSYKKLLSASQSEISTVEGFGASSAKKLYKELHPPS